MSKADLDLAFALRQLAIRRPIFHSEADFQHELAHEIRCVHPDFQVRLERPLDDGSRGATDIVVRTPSGDFGLELKYMTKRGIFDHLGETFRLRHQGAHDIRRYDVCKDIHRMESFCRQGGVGAAVVVLTNDPSFWMPRDTVTIDRSFRISEGTNLGGELRWGEGAGLGTVRNRERPLPLGERYEIRWDDYSDLDGPAGHFRYLLLAIA